MSINFDLHEAMQNREIMIKFIELKKKSWRTYQDLLNFARANKDEYIEFARKEKSSQSHGNDNESKKKCSKIV